jgi:malate dehydrogenase (quinone)
MYSVGSSTVLDSSDVVLIGSGIMSANLGAMLKRLEPRLRIQMIEVTRELAREASDGWNNAGTGHAGICEISYTTEQDGSGQVPIDRALQIFEQFEHSKQFWGYAAANGMTGDPANFIHSVPHICFMTGAEGVDFLKARHARMKKHHFFRGMTLSVDPSVIKSWAPLVMEGVRPVLWPQPSGPARK